MEHEMVAAAKGHQKSRKPEKGIRKKIPELNSTLKKKRKKNPGTAHGMKKEQNNRQTTMW
jgi:hypothetical protein